MRLLANIVFAVAAGCSGASAAFGGDMTAQCPGVLTEDVLKPGTPVVGWQTVPSQQHLIGAGMMGGAPETETYLVPEKQANGKQTFEFAKGDGQRWLWCLYGGMRLAHRLDDRATSCTITTKTKKPENNLSVSVQCK